MVFLGYNFNENWDVKIHNLMLRCGTESYRTKAIGLSDHPKWMEFGSIFIQDVSPTNCPDLEIKLKDVKSKELGRYVCKNSFEWPIYKICDLEIWKSVLENMSIPIQPSMSDVRVRQFFCYLWLIIAFYIECWQVDIQNNRSIKLH